jgi:hypothetical protein
MIRRGWPGSRQARDKFRKLAARRVSASPEELPDLGSVSGGRLRRRPVRYGCMQPDLKSGVSQLMDCAILKTRLGTA